MWQPVPVGTKIEKTFPIQHRIGNYHFIIYRVQSRVATVHASTIQAISYVGYEMRSAVTVEASIYNREFLKIETDYDIISQQTINDIEKRLEQVKFLAEHLDLVPITDKIKEVAQALKDRVKDE